MTMHASCEICEHTRRLHALIAADQMDAAIDAGLMKHVPCPIGHGVDDAMRAHIVETQERLHAAWQARERYRQRGARLARRAAEREARRAQPVAATPAARPAPSLPPAAADILARAKAKAAERMKR